ncbi:hypothetical protein CHS0354_005207 [Potamilus streckersoni]|uniref:NodB homology domain-containing protein n=1 Tax=Potamilus streckersoni TaxID=2493646 RepID=A0AAE0S3U2_9BIVA|nr:hypothetical protein CHS0354_005207 [Potamilus streckersoni]
MKALFRLTLCILFFLKMFLDIVNGYDPATCIECRKSQMCNPPECFCCRDELPLPKRDIPQMVFFTFDDAVTPQVAGYYRKLFDANRKNPNGCPIKMTLFISHGNTVYNLVREFYLKGMEIASHSVSHGHPDVNTFLNEAKRQKENLAKQARIPYSEIVGWRSPFLEPLGDTQPDTLHKLGYKYDATLTVSKRNINDKAVTPFTLDYGWPYDCKIKPCPGKHHSGFWEIPVVSLLDYMKKYDCVYVDGCNNPPPDEESAYRFLWDNFQSYYKSNKAPFGINMHASWFYYPDRMNAMDRFIQDLANFNDVYIVSAKQVIEWLRHPTPLSHIHNFEPWSCGTQTNMSSAFQVRQQKIQNSLNEIRHKNNVLEQKNIVAGHQEWVEQQRNLRFGENTTEPYIHSPPVVLGMSNSPWQLSQTYRETAPQPTIQPPQSPINFWWKKPQSFERLSSAETVQTPDQRTLVPRGDGRLTMPLIRQHQGNMDASKMTRPVHRNNIGNTRAALQQPGQSEIDVQRQKPRTYEIKPSSQTQIDKITHTKSEREQALKVLPNSQSKLQDVAQANMHRSTSQQTDHKSQRIERKEKMFERGSQSKSSDQMALADIEKLQEPWKTWMLAKYRKDLKENASETSSHSNNSNQPNIQNVGAMVTQAPSESVKKGKLETPTEQKPVLAAAVVSATIPENSLQNKEEKLEQIQTIKSAHDMERQASEKQTSKFPVDSGNSGAKEILPSMGNSGFKITSGIRNEEQSSNGSKTLWSLDSIDLASLLNTISLKLPLKLDTHGQNNQESLAKSTPLSAEFVPASTKTPEVLSFKDKEILESDRATMATEIMTTSSILFEYNHVTLAQTRAKDSSCIQGDNCIAPECVCKSETVPAGVKNMKFPQIVYITIDGDINFQSYAKMRQIFAPTRTNPNGCKISGTFFVTHSGTNYRLAQILYSDGIEIALNGLQNSAYNNIEDFLRDIQSHIQKIETETSISRDQIKGWRSPDFRPLGDAQFNILRNESLYDSSLISERSDSKVSKLWPFTLDFGWGETCEIEVCPTVSHPSVWEIPIIPIRGMNGSTPCEYADGCNTGPSSEDDTFQFLMENFRDYYNTNRAPFGLRLHQNWFHWYYRENMNGLLKFIDSLLQLGDVYFVSIANTIEWMKKPTSLSEIKNFEPWRCS